MAYARHQGETTTSEILRIALGIELGRQEMIYTKRVSAILRSNGWEQYRQKIGNSRPWAWRLKSSPENQKSLGNKADQGGSPGSLSPNLELDTELENQKSLGNKADQGRSPGSLSQNSQSDPPCDPARRITPQPLHNETFELINPPVIRLDPPTLPNFSENNFVAQAQITATSTEPTGDSSAVTRPAKCRYYQIVEAKPTIFKIETDFGTVSVSAEPYHRLGTGESKIWFEFQTPDGQILTKSIKADPDKKLYPRLAKECSVVRQWQEKTRKHFASKIENPGCKFKVRILGNDDYEWVEDCILKTVPNYPIATHFIFKTPNNTVITSQLGEFEEM
uniref:Uncharacterized protein n=1 Tax=Desmonostoc muscorum LEGE 12446 TaxID=1828758 RepID=A0A8J7DAV3_DESMC